MTISTHICSILYWIREILGGEERFENTIKRVRVVVYVDVFFFQAEDGIRDYKVTGVQTCALPIWAGWKVNVNAADEAMLAKTPGIGKKGAAAIVAYRARHPFHSTEDLREVEGRSEERSVGKECRSRWSPYH